MGCRGVVCTRRADNLQGTRGITKAYVEQAPGHQHTQITTEVVPVLILESTSRAHSDLLARAAGRPVLTGAEVPYVD